ncbi:hypothetical protein [Paracoccus sphaerophysae]|uniref:hypothetical protein n=1 Tax=Paracoccus sphaerophysae TaxID=690417 RepID=UPI00235770A2|nr:hypothetical protein [Paracoccus sphaerophysae]
MNPRRALTLSLVLVAIGACSMIPLLGLFDSEPASGGMQTLAAVGAGLALISAGVFAGEIGPAAAWPRMLDLTVTVVSLIFVALLMLADAPADLVPDWLADASRMAGDATRAAGRLPREMLLAVPAAIALSALLRARRAAS